LPPFVPAEVLVEALGTADPHTAVIGGMLVEFPFPLAVPVLDTVLEMELVEDWVVAVVVPGEDVDELVSIALSWSTKLPTYAAAGHPELTLRASNPLDPRVVVPVCDTVFTILCCHVLSGERGRLKAHWLDRL
jgi:hypothetical protein